MRSSLIKQSAVTLAVIAMVSYVAVREWQLSQCRLLIERSIHSDDYWEQAAEATEEQIVDQFQINDYDVMGMDDIESYYEINRTVPNRRIHLFEYEILIDGESMCVKAKAALPDGLDPYLSESWSISIDLLSYPD